jgi:hypothetical protein
MAEVRFGGPLGKHLVNGKPTELRGFGSLEVSAENDAVGAHATKVLVGLLARPGFDLAGALKNTARVQAELEAQLTKDLAGQLSVRVTMLMLTVPA